MSYHPNPGANPNPGPGPYGAGPRPGPYGLPPSNNLVWAILSLLLCFLPTGIVAVVYATQVEGRWAQGDVAGAHESARKAMNWSIAGAIVSVAIVTLFFVLSALLPLWMMAAIPAVTEGP